MQSEPLPWKARDQAFQNWRELGFSSRHARALLNLGFVSLEDLKQATDFDLRVLPGIAGEGLVLIYRLIGRESPLKLKSKAEVRSEYEREWRSSMGDERVNRLLDDIAAMAAQALDKANLPAAQTLWDMARRRRAS